MRAEGEGPGGHLRFAVLGPVRAWRGEEQLDLGTARQRAVAAVLLLHANRPVGRGSLIEAVWGDPAPAYAVNQLQKYVSALRRTLEPGREARAPSGVLGWSESGYVLRVGAEGLDLSLFERRVGQGRRAAAQGDARLAAAELHDALGLFTGPALADVSSAVLDAERDRLAELRTTVLEERIQADLDLGLHGRLIAELTRLAAEFPLRERFAALLMLALFRAGRQGDALSVYHQVRRSLRDELGVSPGAEVEELHGRILAASPSLSFQGRTPNTGQARTPSAEDGDSTAEESEPEGPDSRRCVHQLPMDVAEFVGRQQELCDLRELAGDTSAGGTDRRGRGGLVAVVEGMAGVGKTRFAVRAAHEFVAQDRFTDVQLWADLKGFTPSRSPADPANVLEEFLRLLGVPGDRVPEGLEARAALYRDRLAHRRALVVLDDAADAEQVRHLLPGSASCLSLITSRRVLSGLDGAHTIRLEPLSRQEAVELLERAAGPRHREKGSAAAVRVAELSGRLPIAVALAGRRLRTRPAWSMEDLADRLEADEERLARLTVGKRALDATFDLSYDGLPPAQQRAFTLLATHPGADCTPDSAAALLGTSRGEAEELLESLLDDHLLQQHVAGRYRYHDLLRLYARRRAGDAGGSEQRAAAVRRLVHWYCTGAEHARRSIEPWWRPGPSAGALSNDGHHEGPPFADGADSALKWLEEERANLVAVSREAAQHGMHGCVWRLATAAHALLGLRSYGTDSMEGLELGLAAAQRLDDSTLQARILADTGAVCEGLGRHEEAEQHHHCALAVFEETGDRHGVAGAYHGLGCASFGLGRYAESAERHGRALALFEETGDQRGQALALGSLGLVNWFIRGRYRESEEQHRRALKSSEDCGDRRLQAYELAGLGLAHWFFGDYAECARRHRHALTLFEKTGDRRGQAISRNGLGLAEWHLGRPAVAGDHHRQALGVFREVCDRRGEAVALQRVGYVNWATGRYDVGEKQLQETLAICAETGNRSTEAWALASLGYLCLRLQRNDEGEEHLRKALSLSRALGDRHPEASALVGLALIRLNQGEPSSSEEGGRQALALAQGIGNPHNEAWAMIALGFACCYSGRPQPGADWHRRAAGIGRRTGDPFTESSALNGLGHACRRLERYEEAEQHLRTALAMRRRIGDRHGEAETLAESAALMEATGRPDAASAHRELAEARFAGLGVPAV